jgi:hypothetical protein
MLHNVGNTRRTKRSKPTANANALRNVPFQNIVVVKPQSQPLPEPLESLPPTLSRKRPERLSPISVPAIRKGTFVDPVTNFNKKRRNDNESNH